VKYTYLDSGDLREHRKQKISNSISLFFAIFNTRDQFFYQVKITECFDGFSDGHHVVVVEGQGGISL